MRQAKKILWSESKAQTTFAGFSLFLAPLRESPAGLAKARSEELKPAKNRSFVFAFEMSVNVAYRSRRIIFI